MDEPIFDPAVPYIGPIHEGSFRPGKKLKIQGTIPVSAYRFNIALQCGPETIPRDDVALLITVRLLDGYVSLNSLENGIWGVQQRGSAFSVKRGEQFDIALICDNSDYKVAINGQHYCIFPQRIRYDCITHLAIDGDVSVVEISYESRQREMLEEPHTYISASPTEQELDVVKLIDASPLPGLHPTRPIGFSEKPTSDNIQGSVQQFSIAEAEPLNTKESGNPPNPNKNETIDRYYWQKCCGLFWGVVICIIIIFAIVISQADKRPILIKHYNSTSNETYVNYNETFAISNQTFAENNETLASNNEI